MKRKFVLCITISLLLISFIVIYQITIGAQTTPIVLYSFDETTGTTAIDTSGNNKNATLNEGATWVSGKTKNAVDLSGNSQYVSMPSSIISTLNDFTISTWIKLDTTSTWSRIFDFGKGTSVNMFLTPQSNNGSIRFAITTGGANTEEQINGSLGLGSGSWKHIAVTLLGSTGILYVDGVEVGRNTGMTLKPSSLGNTENNYIGKSQYSSDPYLDGQIDEFRIYDRALSSSEVSSLYGGTATTPVATNSYVDYVYPLNTFKIQKGTLWSNRTKVLITNWIPHCYNQLSNTSLAEGGIENFVQAGRKLNGQSYKAHVGYWFSNAYVYNTVEAMCDALMIDSQGDTAISNVQTSMRTKLNDWIPKILSAQESDGYIHTWTTLGNNSRWTDRSAHEGYTAGYFIEMAIAHHMMTGKTDTTLYNAAKKLADCWYNNVGPNKKRWWDGHQEMEQACTRFARYINSVEGSGKGDKYIQLAKALMDVRNSGGEYDQSQTYPVNQTTAVGHSVRAVYMYSGMADVGYLLNNSSYLNSANQLWDNLINKKMYVTGGLGSGESSEGFGPDYSLANSTAYCETCAGCGNLFFQHKMNMAYQDGKYADLMELSLYNNILGSIDSAGNNFTYTNPLDSSSSRYSWHTCPCCVVNLARTMLSLPTWTYTKSADTIYVNMFIGSTVDISNISGTNVQIVQSTDYPWSGNVSLTVNPSTAKKFTLKIRVPDRSVSTCYSSSPDSNGITSASVNGSAVSTTINKGYITINRTWSPGDKIDLLLPMNVQRVKAVPNVSANNGRVALQYGPLIYNIESVDNNNANVDSLILNSNSALSTQWNSNLLNGVVTIKGTFSNGTPMTAIPNYARNNRGGRSLIWIRDN